MEAPPRDRSGASPPKQGGELLGLTRLLLVLKGLGLGNVAVYGG